MSNKHYTDKSSTSPSEPHSREVGHPSIGSKNTFEVPFDFISSHTTEQYPPNIPTPNPSYTSSPDIPHQDSSSNEES